jgi:hypothetical protein
MKNIVILFLSRVPLQYLGIFGFIYQKNILAEVETGCQPPLFHEKDTLWMISQIKLYAP